MTRSSVIESRAFEHWNFIVIARRAFEHCFLIKLIQVAAVRREVPHRTAVLSVEYIESYFRSSCLFLFRRDFVLSKHWSEAQCTAVEQCVELSIEQHQYLAAKRNRKRNKRRKRRAKTHFEFSQPCWEQQSSSETHMPR